MEVPQKALISRALLLFDLRISTLEQTYSQGLSLFDLIRRPFSEKSPIPRILLKNKKKISSNGFILQLSKEEIVALGQSRNLAKT